jgi:hypothetical protein
VQVGGDHAAQDGQQVSGVALGVDVERPVVHRRAAQVRVVEPAPEPSAQRHRRDPPLALLGPAERPLAGQRAVVLALHAAVREVAGGEQQHVVGLLEDAERHRGQPVGRVLEQRLLLRPGLRSPVRPVPQVLDVAPQREEVGRLVPCVHVASLPPRSRISARRRRG